MVRVETHTSLFHPDHRLIVVEGGREEVKRVDTRRFVIGQLEGRTPSTVQLIVHHFCSMNLCSGEEGSLVYGVVVDGVLEGVIHSRG